jgi:DNA-binding XRE family transcriptional regulator
MKKNRASGRKIEQFRRKHYATQKAFADDLGLGQTVVSAWERGDNVPSSEAWVKIASLAPAPDNLWFLEQAGLSKETIMAAAKALGESIRVRPEEGDMIQIPRFRVTKEGRDQAGPPVRLEPEFVPNPLDTTCISVDETSTGVKRSPSGLYVVDTSAEGAEDVSALWGRFVAIDYRPEHAPLTHHGGIHFGVLMLEGQEGPPHGSDTVTLTAFLLPIPLFERPHIYLQMGHYIEAEGLRGIGREDSAGRAMRVEEIRKGCLSTFRLDKGVRILGEVTSYLTGHLKASREGGK